MENLCNFYRFQSLARLLIPRIFALRRLWSYNKRNFLYRPAPVLPLSCVFLSRSRAFLFFGAYALSNKRGHPLSIPRPVSLSALCLSYLYPPRFCFSAPLVLQQTQFSLPPRAPYRFSSLSTYCRHETYHPRLLFSSHFFRTLRRRIRLNGISALVFFVFFQRNRLSRRFIACGRCGGVASFLADCLSSDCATQLNCLTHSRKSDRIKTRKVFGKHFRIKKPR